MRHRCRIRCCRPPASHRSGRPSRNRTRTRGAGLLPTSSTFVRRCRRTRRWSTGLGRGPPKQQLEDLTAARSELELTGEPDSITTGIASITETNGSEVLSDVIRAEHSNRERSNVVERRRREGSSQGVRVPNAVVGSTCQDALHVTIQIAVLTSSTSVDAWFPSSSRVSRVVRRLASQAGGRGTSWS